MARRLACLDLAAFPLQLLLRAHPDWRSLPAVVVDVDRPEGRVCWANHRALEAGVLSGQRYATALSLCEHLRAGLVPPEVIGQGVAQVLALLRAFSPDLEASPEEPGVFWLDTAGLYPLYPSLEAWAQACLKGVAEAGFEGALVVAFTRFGSYALARSHSTRPDADPVLILAEAADERARLASVRLDRLALEPPLRDRLARLGVHTLGALAALPPVGLRQRYGPALARLHAQARGERSDPLAPSAEAIPLSARADLDFPERDAHRLLFRCKALLDPQLRLLAARGLHAHAVLLTLDLEVGASVRTEEHRLRPAAPGLEAELLLDLIRLRLEGLSLGGGVVSLGLELLACDSAHLQNRLFHSGPRRDVALAARALARVRAELGEAAVGRFRLRAGHLPRASFTFDPLGGEALAAPLVSPTAEEAPVRRLHRRAQPLTGLRLASPGPELSLPPPSPPITRLYGAAIIAGGWWQREVRRLYAYAETEAGVVLWLYYDLRRQAWFEEGRLE